MDLKKYSPYDNIEQNYQDFKYGKLILLSPIMRGENIKFILVYKGDIIYTKTLDTYQVVRAGSHNYDKNLVTTFIYATQYFNFDINEFIENYRHNDRYFRLNNGWKFYIKDDKYYVFRDDIIVEVTEQYFVINLLIFLNGLYGFDIKEGDIEEGEIEI